MYDADAPEEPMDGQAEEPEAKLVLTDQDFLSIVAEQRRQSIGFDGTDESGTLAQDRETALNYIKGEMPDVPSLPNRSKAVSTDVSDAIETALPDLVEIFVGGDDVATFQATGAEDEDQAKSETEVVQHVIFEQNPGFLLFYTFIKDALTSKLGIAKSWWEDKDEPFEERVEGVSVLELQAVTDEAQGQGFEVVDVAASEPDAAGNQAFSFTVKGVRKAGCERNMAVPPEDFAYARDTVALRDTSYCAMRSRPRAQDLIEQGYDADKVADLPDYSSKDDATEQARDTVGETQERPTSDAYDGLRPVEIVEHYVRLDADGDGKTELWKVVTGGGETVLLEKERVPFVPFAAITPYIVTHRLMGRSLADLLLEIQRIKTALLRMLLDSGYFALNQRHEVAMDKANEWTVTDLLRNEPNMPVRSKDGTAVRALTSGGLSFDATGALEFMSTVAEQRTGIVRNAQGLNPDTLHDTAAGARQLIGAAQKRIRLIARVFAETGVKDLFLNVHELLRRHGHEFQGRIGGRWTNVDPTTWRERKGLKVEIGVGAGGREHDIMAGQQLLQMQAQAVQAQGGIDGPLTNAEAIIKAAKRQTERLGFRDGEQYWTTPEQWAQAQQARQGQPPPPDPKLVEVQQKGQLAQQSAMADVQLQQAKQQSDAQLAQADAERQHALRQAEMEANLQLKREQIAAEMDLKREQLAAELQLKRDQMQAELQFRAAGMMVDANVSAATSDVRPGGEAG